ncbi:MAG: aryl-sulfate sulfotransferase [Desulfobacter sp.]|nr:MAG: aryl-sulfate sulfotransferase [Desulfobacter sp.]
MKILPVFYLLFLAILSAHAGDYKVTHFDQNRVFKGTTLLADMSDPRIPKVVEIDFKGNILWAYRPSMKGAVLDASRLSNGNTLITIHGSGIYEISPDKKIIWSHKDRAASHDADRLPNGNTLYNLGWRAKGEDVVREIDPMGNLVWSWKGIEDYDKAPFAEIDSEGWMHLNSVTRLPSGNTLVSMRNFNTVAEISPNGRVVREWTFRGKDRRTQVQTQGIIEGERNHEPEIIGGATMLLALRRPNRFVEFDLNTQKIVWEWSHPKGNKALRTNREANRLPNGNTLGTAGDKIVEIAPDGTLVWQVLAPRGQSKNHRKFHKAIRIGANGQTYGG